MGLDRRTFLQKAAIALVSAGASEAGVNLLSKNPLFSRWLKPYVETLAQTTNRKLALLIGIDEYSERSHLTGCVNDVNLQRELLIHCFGFQPEDIQILANRQATKSKIETAFDEHLVKQVQNNDVVLFHFSGYGSQIETPDSENPLNSLLAVDASAEKTTQKNGDLLQDSLYELGRSLSTANLITILDTSFQPTTEKIQGNYRIRSTSKIVAPASKEAKVQKQSFNPLEGISLGATSNIPGIVLSAANKNQLALEGTWNGFSAGLLTYALTRYLWETNSRTTIQVAFQQAANGVNSWSDKEQQPQIDGKLKSNIRKDDTSTSTGGEGFIVEQDSKGTVKLRLTALAPVLLDSYHEESCFSVPEAEAPTLQLRSLEGIEGKAQLLGNSPKKISGKAIREAIRVLPHDLGLSVALDNHLERIERVDATSAFAAMSEIKSVTNAGEAYADCVVGKISVMVDKSTEGEPHSSEKPVYSYGIYTPRGKLIANTPGEANEVVKLALKRLQPYFERLLAAKWLKLLENENSSTIPVTATIESVSRNSSLISKTTLRTDVNDLLEAEIPSIQGNSPLRMRIENKSDRDLYGIMVGVDNEEKFATLYIPQATVNTPDSLVVAAGSQSTIPESSSQWQWKAIKPSGITKMYLILATQPFSNTLSFLSQQPVAKVDNPELVGISQPLELIDAILTDLHASSGVSPELLTSSELYALDVNQWTAFNFVYDVI